MAVIELIVANRK